MSVVSFEDWKKKKQHNAAYNSRGGLREDIALKEEYGYDLCVFLSDERNAENSDPARIEQLWQDLHSLMDTLPHEHAYYYFKAFEAYCSGDEMEFSSNFDRYLASEKQLYGDVNDSDWWVDTFIWVFTPAFPGMYERASRLFFKHWPLCAMGLVCSALEYSTAEEEAAMEMELKLLMLAIGQDPKCYLAYYVAATVYVDLKLWRSALHYFEKAADSAMYSQDPAFYYDYARAAERAGKSSLAVDLYNSCLLLDETFPYAASSLGALYLNLGRYEEALTQFSRAISLNLDGDYPYRCSVFALGMLGRYEEALRFLQTHIASGRLAPEQIVVASVIRGIASGTLPPDSLAALIRLPGESAEDSSAAGLPALLDKHTLADELERRILVDGRLFDRTLSIHEDDGGYGREYWLAEAGLIDLLCRSKEGFVVVCVLPRSCTPQDLELLEHQMQAVRKKLAHRFQKVAGILVCTGAQEDCDPSVRFPGQDLSLYQLDFALTRLSFSTKKNDLL